MKRIIKTMAFYLAERDVIRKAIAKDGDFRVYTNRPSRQGAAGFVFYLLQLRDRLALYGGFFEMVDQCFDRVRVPALTVSTGG